MINLYLKRKQAVQTEKLSTECDGKSIVLQVYFSENAILLTENEIQSAYWNYSQGTVFTVHAWINGNSSESFAILSDHLSLTKDAVYTFMESFSKYIKEKYPLVILINTLSNGAPTQFKQHFLFSDLHPRENEFNINLIWHYITTSHSKGAVDGIGGTVKRSVWKWARPGGDTY